MVRISPHLIALAPERLNPLGERELSLRGLAIPAIENLGAANDQHQTVDLSDNEIAALGGFPLMKRLRVLILHSNRISTISPNLSRTLPWLRELLLADNRIDNLQEVERLASLEHLTCLALHGNPVVTIPHYRLFVISKIPSLEVLDYQRVTLAERKEAKKMFPQGATAPAGTAKAGKPLAAPTQLKPLVVSAQTLLERRAAIEKAIAAATTMEEVQRLENILASGNLPELPSEVDAPSPKKTVPAPTPLDSAPVKAESPSAPADTEQEPAAKEEPAPKRARVVEEAAVTPVAEAAASLAKSVDKMTVPELKAELARRGLDTSGLKAVLLARLKESGA